MLETARTHWVAEKITGKLCPTRHWLICQKNTNNLGQVRNISNCMSIGTHIDKMSQDLKEVAKTEGWWKEGDEFHWANVIGEGQNLPRTKLATPTERFEAGKMIMTGKAERGTYSL